MTLNPLATDKEGVLADLISKAMQAGADAADALIYDAHSQSVSYRLGAVEKIDRSEGQDVGLRVIFGQRQAQVSSSDLSENALSQLVDRSVAMAKLAPEDPYCGLAPSDRLAREIPDLDLNDPSEPDAEVLVDVSREAEEAALEVKGITNSFGASAGSGRIEIALATSEGFCGTYSTSSHSISCGALAGEGADMERDFDARSTRHRENLPPAADIGRSAAKRAVAKLNSRKVESQSVPIVYDPRVSNSLVAHFAGAISGASVARGASFFKESLGSQVLSQSINIVDEPHIRRGLGSKPFDGEGVSNKKHQLARDGILTTWLLDCASARQLGLETTGHATRGTGGPPRPSTTNLYLEAGSLSPDDLIADIRKGFYVTEFIGRGINGVTGDYSRGAGGFWIEDSEITYPVNEITIAGNLKSMFLEMTASNDLEFRYGTNAPTLRIEGMTIAGR